MDGMKSDFLKQTEIFVFLSLTLSIFIAALAIENGTVKKQLAEVRKENANLKEKIKTLIQKNTPPAHIVIDSANGGHFFESNSAELTFELREHIEQNVVRQILDYKKKYSEVNAIFIIGHTDDRKVNKNDINVEFEKQLSESMLGVRYISDVIHNTNSDLGLARAYSIYEALEKDLCLRKVFPHMYFYSAGPFVSEKSNMTKITLDNQDNEKKRRIEIRLVKIDPIRKNRTIDEVEACNQ